ncbi:DUF4115 domain-containing protein [Richelia intracellularis]|uniref:DUF4115 domain-containing protein n=1 Tax=Richelia intracellularis TaxID=1164990 RepID=UPI000693E42E|nr:DUF4115 domain-containing protein [Richelia intracellularis]
MLVSFASLVLFYILDLSKKTAKISYTNYSNHQVNHNTHNLNKNILENNVPIPIYKTVVILKPLFNPNQLQITIKLQGKSWLRVIVDNKKVFEGIIDRGAQKIWKAEKRIFVRSGNAGAILLSINGEKEKILGKQGEIREFILTNKD